MYISIINPQIREKLLYILFGTNNWEQININMIINNLNVRSIEYNFINNYPSMLNSEKYRLCRLVKENAESNIVQLQGLLLGFNIFTLDQIKRNTRSCIEAYINLVALMNEDLYINLYNKECRQNYSEEGFRFLLEKYNIQIKDVLHYDIKQQKYTYVMQNAKFKVIGKIIESLKFDRSKLDQLTNEYKRYNNYSHSNIYANLNDNIEIDIRSLLDTNLYVLMKSIAYYIQSCTSDTEYNNNWKICVDNLCNEINKIRNEIKENNILVSFSI